MHLKTGDVEFDLKTLGYAHTTGWLRIHVSVRHPKATWRTAGAILLPDDLRALGEWLCKVSAGDMTQRQISFTEPNLSFEILPTAGKPESLRLNLSYETAPPFMQGEERYEGFAIDFPLAEIDLQAAREAVLLQVKVFPERKER